MSKKFVHLQCHSEFSLLEGALRIPEMLSLCRDNDMPAVALTDNGTMFGCIDFYLRLRETEVNPIVGCELLLCKDISVKERTYDRILLLSKNLTGYQNLVELVTIANLDGFYYRPRIDIAHLAKFSEGIIAISPGTRGPVGDLIRLHTDDAAKELAQQFQAIYKDDFYLGVHKLDVPFEDTVNEGSRQLQKEIGVELVALNDVYYPTPDKAFVRDILACIQSGKTINDDSRAKFLSKEQFFRTREQMEAILPDYIDAIDQTVAIAEKCNLEMEVEQVILPNFDCPDQLTPEAYLSKLVWEGIDQKYGEVTPEIKERVDYELGIIERMQYPIYFLIIYDFLDFCTREGIPVGPGRGSAAGSIVAYALNITKIDPLRYKLLFERFLNPERISMPDVDIDFCIKRRQEVIDYLVERYGADNVAQIATFGTMAARGVVRDVGRALGVPLTDVDMVAKLIPSAPGKMTSISQALEEVPDLAKLKRESEEISQLLDVGMQLEGQARHTSTHAAGVVISRDPLTKIVPLIRNEGQVTTQYQMTDLERVGLLKMDILGLRNLTVLKHCVDLIKQEHGVDIDLDDLPDDEKTYALLCTGETGGVFQCESRGMRQLIKDLKPSVFEDIIALLALYRPGPLGSGMVSDFISNKSGETQVQYELPELEPILADTYGMIVYQEQVMQIASTIGGFSLGQADMLRKAMGKKKKDVMDKMKDDFLDGAKDKGINVGKAEKIFDLCYKFAEYGFNKSHSAAYALISYQTAYLKTNYPVEYMAALLSSVLGNAEKTAMYIADCRILDIEVLPPTVNESIEDFLIAKKVEDKRRIRFGLRAIKNVGEGAIQNIIEERDKEGPYKNLMNFLQRVDLRQVNKRVVESLIKSGCLDDFGDRSKLLAIYEPALESAQVLAKEKSSGQFSLFGGDDDDGGIFAREPEVENYTRYSTQVLLRMEKELLGLYLSSHPLSQYQDKLEKLHMNTQKLSADMEKKEIMMAGLITGTRKLITKKGRQMWLSQLEDLYGSVTIMGFEKEDGSMDTDAFEDDAIVYIWGRPRINQDEISITVDRIERFENSQLHKRLYIDIESIEDMGILETIKQANLSYNGSTPVYFKCGGKVVLADRKYWIQDDPLYFTQLENIIGSGQLTLA